MQRCIIDTDGGIDDALALILALHSPELSIQGITVTAGNTALDQAIENVYRILELTKRLDIPVASGAKKPLVYEASYNAQIHGKDGVGNLEQYNQSGVIRYAPVQVPEKLPDAVNFLIENVDHVDVCITLGPLTNLAQMAQKAPEAFKKIPHIVTMGGAFYAPGNITSKAEFNLWADPHAADIVFRQASRVTCVGLDVTTQVIMPYDRVLSLTQQYLSPLTQFIVDETKIYADFYQQTDRIHGFLLHDPLAVLAVIAPDVFIMQAVEIQIEMTGYLTRGMVVIDERLRKTAEGTSAVKVALGVKQDLALSLIEERLWRC